MKKRIRFLNQNKFDDESGGPFDSLNMYIWIVNFNGPKESDYERGRFHVEITFTSDYPKTMPSCKFLN